MPLDRTGVVPGTIPIRVARQVSAPAGAGTLLQLFGGPGQGAADAAPFVVQTNAAALRHYRLVLIDQRGTGHSSPLVCTGLQKFLSLAAVSPQRTAGCAAAIGRRRAFFTTTDSVEDIEALRVALGVPKLALEGTSYGTYVALQYARQFPATTDRLVLDSIVEPSGVNTFAADSFRAMPRVLRAICSGGGCRGITSDPVGDVLELTARLGVKPLTGTVRGPDGTPVRQTIDAQGLFTLLQSGYLNEPLRAALPGAVHAALEGDPASLLRLARPALGVPNTVGELSVGLFATTTCTDIKLSYPLSTPLQARPAAIAAAVAKLSPSMLGGFPVSVARAYSSDVQCRLWPGDPPSQAQDRGVPADVPALVLSGAQDDVTPLENGIEMARLFPKAQRVVVPGTGHDTIDSDHSGCVQTALLRFFSDKPVGRPCTKADNSYPPQPSAPASLRATTPAPGVGGERGRVLAAAVGAVNDTRFYFLALGTGGLPDTRGPGLRGGTWRFVTGGAVAFHGVSSVPGVSITGTLTSRLGRYSGTLAVAAPDGLGGTLRFRAKTGVTGTLGGAAVKLGESAVRGAVQRT